MTIFRELKRRNLIAQASHEKEIEELLSRESVKFYCGFDATADSLHIGHLVQLIIMRYLQKSGHKPYALLGTGTTLIGDPSGRTDMRQMLTAEGINKNADIFKEHMSRFVDFDVNSVNCAEFVRNGDWLLNLKYLEFIKDIGVHFTVNKMLAAECFKSRMEKGLSFFEFNYMLIQAYDFLHLYQTKGITLEIGGDDQWSNILAGADLIRRKLQKPAFAMTSSLLLTKDGKKMGKTQKGALWLSAEKCPVYDFYQYFRNVDDAEVINCFKMLTFVPLDEIAEFEKLVSSCDGKQINTIKERLAFEVTELVHGREEAEKAQNAAKSVFAGTGESANMPTTVLNAGDFDESGRIRITDLLVKCRLCPSGRDAKTNIEQGGVSVDDVKITDPAIMIEINTHVIIKKGKKTFHKAAR